MSSSKDVEEIADDEKGVLAQVVSQKRKELHFSLRDVEIDGGIDAGQVSKIESGTAKRPTLSTVLRVFKGLNMSAGEFFKRSGLPYNPQKPSHVPTDLDREVVLNMDDLETFIGIVSLDPDHARRLLARLLNMINDAKYGTQYGAGPAALRFDAATVDLFLDDAAVQRQSEPVYRFKLRYPERIALQAIREIDGNKGVLLPQDIAIYLRHIYFAKLHPEAQKRPEAILSRLDALLPESITFYDVIELERYTGYTGYILDMYQRACTFNDNRLQSNPHARWDLRERGFTQVFIFACRWLQHLHTLEQECKMDATQVNRSWLVEVRGVLHEPTSE